MTPTNDGSLAAASAAYGNTPVKTRKRQRRARNNACVSFSLSLSLSLFLFLLFAIKASLASTMILNICLRYRRYPPLPRCM